MPASSPPAPLAAPEPAGDRAAALLRVGAIALALLMVGAVLYSDDAPAWRWVGPVLHFVLGSGAAWRLATRAEGDRPLRRWLRWWDHFLVGAWTALIAFNLLPSVLLFCILGLSNGVARIDRIGIYAYGLGTGAGVLVFGAHWRPEPNLVVMLACLPALLAQPFFISHSSRVAIRHLRRRRDDLERLNRHDGLSGLYNRAHWESVLRSEFSHFRRANEPAALVLADLDHFKRINDEHGHAAGDEVIRRFASTLRRLLRATDLPGRYGGEEFGILLPHTSAEAAREVVERLRRELHEHPLLDGKLVTASFGIAMLTPETETHAAWLRLADQMLYRAKHLGRDRVVMLGDVGAAAHAPAPDPHHMQPSAAVLAALRDPAVLPHLLSGLDMSESPLALFDANDRLVLANLAFLTLYGVAPGEHTFGDIMRGCWQQEVGPKIDADDIEAWLRMALGKRRTRPRRSFAVDMLDGRWFWVIETTFSDGWVLVTLNDITDTMGVGAEGGTKSVHARLRDRRALSAHRNDRTH
jgi:diguanylate cyclase (GGDEF)-like protein